jgi:hypothetical protein
MADGAVATECLAGPGAARASPRCRVARPFIHSTPASRAYAVPRVSNRQCDAFRNPRCRNAVPPRLPSVARNPCRRGWATARGALPAHPASCALLNATLRALGVMAASDLSKCHDAYRTPRAISRSRPAIPAAVINYPQHRPWWPSPSPA